MTKMYHFFITLIIENFEIFGYQSFLSFCINVMTNETKTVLLFKVPEYALYEIHEAGERRLNMEEKPLLVQLNWHKDDR